MQIIKLSSLCFTLAVLQMSSASATTLAEATQQAVLRNPEVQARYHNFIASTDQQEAAKGAYYPRLDLEAYTGREWQSTPSSRSQNFFHPGASITLRQILFNGSATANEVKRLGFTRQSRYYELLTASDDTALEAARAYLDVLRYRQLTRLAQENWSIHKDIFGQLDERARAGVGRRIDLEQANGRLALSQSNWLTEVSNEHDVSARYLRVVGEMPAQLSDAPAMQSFLPTEQEVLKQAVTQNPSFQGAVASLRAARAETDVRRAANAPTVEFRASHDIERNRLGEYGHYRDTVAQVVLNYNLYRGGSDQARIREGQNLYYTALDLRDKACRDIRQNAAIAYNDVRRLREQASYLEQHLLSTDKARQAYRQQFDIGQRSLLDVLDTENEAFQARRALVNAQYDLKLAELRVLAQTHRLMSALNLTPLEKEAPQALETHDGANDDALTCNTEMPAAQALNLGK